MASGIFALLDDIGALMDDVATSAKIATQKTAGILGDDLAVNAEKSTGFVSSRELPVLWEITKGSFINKLIIIPVVFLLNIYLPVVITVVLMAGGIYLAYEGAEKIISYLFHRKTDINSTTTNNMNDEISEKKKISDAIKTDFILSIEIVIIALSTVLDKELWLRISTVSIIAIIATIGVYGIVALIVRLDDIGYRFIKKSKGKGFLRTIGRILVSSLPIIIRAMSVIGTIALLLVAGGLFLHNIPLLHHWFENIPELFTSLFLGLIAGILTFLALWLFKKIIPNKTKQTVAKS